jgi:hypothetical protein
MDPAAMNGRSTYGVPLLPNEIRDLLDRSRVTLGIEEVVQQYGEAVPDDWAGLYVDQQRGGLVVAMFEANVDQHRRALHALLPPAAQIEVRSTSWSRQELNAFIERVLADREWFTSVQTRLSTAEISQVDNVVDVRFNGDPDRAGVIEQHFGDPPWLRAVWNGPLPWTGPRGDLLVVVTDALGNPGAGLDVRITPVDASVSAPAGVAYTTDSEGQSLRQNLPAVSVRVQVLRRVGEEFRTIGTSVTAVRPDERTVMRITVPAP